MSAHPPHRPVLLERVTELLVEAPDGPIVDATIGAGGHAHALLAARLTQRPAQPGLRPKEVAVEHDPVRETGAVKWFNVDKGFGFIIRENGEDLFVHFRAISDGHSSRLTEGQTVEYQIGQGRKGPQAEEVVILD